MMVYEITIPNVKNNECMDALNWASNLAFEGKISSISTTFRNDTTTKIIGAYFDVRDNCDKGTVVGYVITKKSFDHLNGTTLRWNSNVPNCILGKDVKIIESKNQDIGIRIKVVQMDMDFAYMTAMLGDNQAMDSPLWGSYMATYFAIRKQTEAYVARKMEGMRWTSVCTSDAMTRTVIDGYSAIGKMYSSKYKITVVSDNEDIEDTIFNSELPWEEDDED